MKYYLTIIIFLFLMNNQINGLEFKNFCRKAKNTNCESYQCGSFFCAVNKESCQQFILWAKLMNNYSNINKKVYNKFIDNIRHCRINVGYKNEWMSNFG